MTKILAIICALFLGAFVLFHVAVYAAVIYLIGWVLCQGFRELAKFFSLSQSSIGS